MPLAFFYTPPPLKTVENIGFPLLSEGVERNQKRTETNGRKYYHLTRSFLDTGNKLN